MRPDFIITQKPSPLGVVNIVLPTHTAALNWMFAHVEATERRSMSAHLNDDRLAQFTSDATLEKLLCTNSSDLRPDTSSPQLAGHKEHV